MLVQVTQETGRSWQTIVPGLKRRRQTGITAFKYRFTRYFRLIKNLLLFFVIFSLPRKFSSNSSMMEKLWVGMCDRGADQARAEGAWYLFSENDIRWGGTAQLHDPRAGTQCREFRETSRFFCPAGMLPTARGETNTVCPVRTDRSEPRRLRAVAGRYSPGEKRERPLSLLPALKK